MEEGEREGGVVMEICKETGVFSLMMLGGENAMVLGSGVEGAGIESRKRMYACVWWDTPKERNEREPRPHKSRCKVSHAMYSKIQLPQSTNPSRLFQCTYTSLASTHLTPSPARSSWRQQ